MHLKFWSNQRRAFENLNLNAWNNWIFSKALTKIWSFVKNFRKFRIFDLDWKSFKTFSFRSLTNENFKIIFETEPIEKNFFERQFRSVFDNSFVSIVVSGRNKSTESGRARPVDNSRYKFLARIWNLVCVGVVMRYFITKLGLPIS